MSTRAIACILLSAIPLVAGAQANSGASAAPVPATPPVVPESPKAGSEPAPRAAPAERAVSGKTRFTPPPMDIRIQEEGVKLPKCTTESREGEACRK